MVVVTVGAATFRVQRHHKESDFASYSSPQELTQLSRLCQSQQMVTCLPKLSNSKEILSRPEAIPDLRSDIAVVLFREGGGEVMV